MNETLEKKIVIRDANPTIAEGLMFAQLMDQAAEGFFKGVLGKNCYSLIADAYIKPNNEYSYQNVTFIEFEGEIAGMVSGFTLREKRGYDKDTLKRSSKISRFNYLIFLAISLVLSQFLGPKSDDDLYIQAIAINKGMRDKGLGFKLMEHAEWLAKSRRAKILSLDVASKNEHGINLYKKCGMRIDRVWPNLPFIPSLFTRMVKEYK